LGHDAAYPQAKANEWIKDWNTSDVRCRPMIAALPAAKAERVSQLGETTPPSKGGKKRD
jgi:hypothetical protein